MRPFSYATLKVQINRKNRLSKTKLKDTLRSSVSAENVDLVVFVSINSSTVSLISSSLKQIFNEPLI